MKKNIYFFNIAAAFILTTVMMTGCKPQIASEQSSHKENLPYNPVDYGSLKSYLENAANKPASDGLYYIEVTELTNDKLKGDMTVIGEYAFSDCRNLMNVVIPNNVTHIDRGTFHNCINAEISLSTNSTNIEEGAFGLDASGYCKKVKIKDGADYEAIKNKVIAAMYPEDRIEKY